MEREVNCRRTEQPTKTVTHLYSAEWYAANSPPNAPTHLRAHWNSLALHARGTSKKTLAVAYGVDLNNASCF